MTGCGSSGSGTAGNAGGNAGSGASNSGGSAGASGGAAGSGSGATGGFAGTGGSSGSSSGGSAGASTGGSGGSAGSSSGGSGGGPADAGLDVQFTYDGPVDDGGFNNDASCAAATAEAKPLPLDIYVMLDQSGSMGSDCNVSGNYQASTGSKWCYAVNALAGFMANANATQDVRVALQYFALGSGTCGGAGYNTPEIALTAIPGGTSAFVASLNSHGPSTGTPTEGAANGLTQFTSNQKASNPNRTIIGILITDGDPSGCTSNLTTIGNILTTAYNGGQGVRSYVIGMSGATFGNLETIAKGGGAPSHSTYCSGAGPCHYYNVANGDYTTFQSVLSTIQASAIGCDYNMPTSDAGIVDPNKVSVEYSPGGNPPPSTIPKVASAAACPAPGGGQGGWYYDNPGNPTKITLCPATCQVVQADANAKVAVNLGCLGS